MDTQHSAKSAFQSLATRSMYPVREHEIMRIEATINGKDTEKAAADARRQILAWVQNRCGGRLPKEAWNFEGFEYFIGGRNSIGARVKNHDCDVWGVRAEDPDKNIAGRTWTTEVAIGAFLGIRPKISVRQVVSTSESDFQISPHSPGFLQQLIETCGLSAGMDDIDLQPSRIRSEDDVRHLVDRLLDPERSLPFIVMSGDERAVDPDEPAFDAEALARSVIGLAHVAVIGSDAARFLTLQIGAVNSVFHGGVRYYLPGFTMKSDPYNHRLFIGHRLAVQDERDRAVRWLRKYGCNR